MDQGVESSTLAGPTPEQVLGWIAAAGGTWFPSRHSHSTGVSRDSLDRPLNELRAADLVKVVDWVRGTGQGYALTPQGEAAASGESPQPAPAEAPAPKPRTEFDRPPAVTRFLAGASLLWFFVGLVVVVRLGHSVRSFLLHGDSTVLIRLGAVSAPDLLKGEWWRLAASCFVHGNIWHLLINVGSLLMLGAVVEHLWGRGRTLLLYLVSGFAGSCLAMALRPMDSHAIVTLMGASGALCGLVSAVVAWVLLHHRQLEDGVTPELVRRLALGIALALAVSLIPGVSWEAHLGGAVAGFVAAMLLETAHSSRGWKRVLSVVLLAMMPATCLGGVLLAARHSPRWAPFRAVKQTSVTLPDPNPHLNAVGPESVDRAVMNARLLLITSPEKWKPERVKAVREEVAALWSNAATAVRILDMHPGDPAGDKAKAFAEARRDSLSALLGFIDRKAMPTVQEWKAWGESQNTANRLWHEAAKKE
jgi:membrane associated rhomboid family serine protease